MNLYKIIYYRALASLLAPAKTENTTILLNNNNYGFKATGQVIVFPGYLKVYDLYEQTTDKILPVLDQTKPLAWQVNISKGATFCTTSWKVYRS